MMATPLTSKAPRKPQLTRRSLLAGLGLGAGLAGLTGCGIAGSAGSESNGGPITLRMALADNNQSNYFRGAEAIAEEVSAATDGRVAIEIIAGGALGDERSTVEMVQNNDLDIATAANTVVSNWIPQMRILDQAFLWENTASAHAAVDGAVGALIHEAARRKRMHVIGYMESGFRNVISTRPVAALSDFSGLKIRTMQSSEQIKAFDWLGAIPVSMPAGDQFTALQQGTIDAVENATANASANSYDEVSQDISETGHIFVYIMMMMSEQAWSRIPEELHTAFTEAVTRGAHRQREFLVEANTEAKQELSANGVTFHEIDRASLIKRVEERRAEHPEEFDPVWQEAVNQIKADHGSAEGGAR